MKSKKLRPFLVRRVRFENGEYAPTDADREYFVQATTAVAAVREIAVRSCVAEDDLFIRVRVTELDSGSEFDAPWLTSADVQVDMARRVRYTKVI